LIPGLLHHFEAANNVLAAGFLMVTEFQLQAFLPDTIPCELHEVQLILQAYCSARRL
jgi:hypothetical protein